MSGETIGYAEPQIVPEEAPVATPEKKKKTLPEKARDELVDIQLSRANEFTTPEKARDELVDIQLPVANEFTTEAISGFRNWFMKNALNDENLKIKLEQTGFFKNDEKATIVMPDHTIVRTLDEKSVLEGKVADIAEMLGGVIINRTKYRDENPSNMRMLIELLEAYSGEIKS